ncbi:DUF3237 family protein [Flagellimonas olearia]|uniref:DUF3237 family protein n=1 Tax=Flagellimonas olearia TaxID=552546 RepID=A0A6I1E994_9FLAO|nr:DUF3237 family protein [Allomuricauda olearia]KAB7530284.1 DUF3237 family protein [Allomuricauda olearia]
MENTLEKTDLALLFEEQVVLSDFVEYGFSMQDLVNGEPIPTEGARFDIYFEGDLIGEKINGKISGVDYLEVRADGRFFLDLHAKILTDDGAQIQVTETGINDHGNLKLNMEFHTNDERYSWLNRAQVLGLGTVDFNTGKALVKGYSL